MEIARYAYGVFTFFLNRYLLKIVDKSPKHAHFIKIVHFLSWSYNVYALKIL